MHRVPTAWIWVTDSNCGLFWQQKRNRFTLNHEEMKGMSRIGRVTRNEQNQARAIFATMDHSDIRELATALHLFFAGLSGARKADHPMGCTLTTVEDSPRRPSHRLCRDRSSTGQFHRRQRYGLL